LIAGDTFSREKPESIDEKTEREGKQTYWEYRKDELGSRSSCEES